MESFVMNKFKVSLLAALVSTAAAPATAAVVTQNFNYIPTPSQTVTIGNSAIAQFSFTGAQFGSASINAIGAASGVMTVMTSPTFPDAGDTFLASVVTGGGTGGGAGYYGLRFMIDAGLTYGYATLGVNGYNFAAVTYEGAPVAVGGVPEPATWAMMLGGFGLIGAATRRHRPRARASNSNPIIGGRTSCAI